MYNLDILVGLRWIATDVLVENIVRAVDNEAERLILRSSRTIVGD